MKYIDFRDIMFSGHKKNTKFIAKEFMGLMLELDTEKK